MHRREFVGRLGMVGAVAAAGIVTGQGAQAAWEVPPDDPSTQRPMDAAAFFRAQKFVRTRFGTIAYLERGSGDAALFLHGFPLNSFQWRGAIDRLSAHRRCIAPDFLALGYTDVAEGQSVDPLAQMAMVVELLDALAIPAADVVASDSGGAVAQLLVARHPARVRTLLLTNCDTETDSPPAALVPVIEMSRAGTFVDNWLAPWFADKGLARSDEGIGGMCYADRTHPTDDALNCYFAPLVSSQKRKALVHAYAIALARNPLEGIEQALRRCMVPARIAWGMADTIFSPDSPSYLDGTFGRSRGVRRLRDAKLFWPEELPDVVAEEARRLWGV